MTAPWLNILGVGAEGASELAPTPARLLENAGVIITSRRLAENLTGLNGTIHTWPSPFDPIIERIRGWKDQAPVILATGEPMWFGIGSTLMRSFQPSEVAIWPTPGAFSLAAARLGWPLDTATCLSLHGRPVETLAASLTPGAKLLCLTTSAETISQIAHLLANNGYGASTMHVLETMATPQEKHTSFTASAVPGDQFDNFNTVAIDCRADSPVALRAKATGLPDGVFIHDGQLTKQTVRAATLAKLAAAPGPVLWDIGAGSGSVAIEWLRIARHHRAIAFEHNETRLANIRQNAANLGVPHLHIAPGKAPQILAGKTPPPDAIFIGGGLTAPGMIDAALAALNPGGVLVANAVSLEGRKVLVDLATRMGKEHRARLEEIAVSNMSALGDMSVLKPALPVLQLSLEKP